MSEEIIKKPLKVAFYIRVSTEDQVDKFGTGLQLDALRALVTSKSKAADGSDLMVFAGEKYVYNDSAVSGTDYLEDRPQFRRLLEDIRNTDTGSRPFDVVAVYKIDRLARRLKILLDVIDVFKEYDIKLMSCIESIDTSTPFGMAILGIMGVIAELELETIKERTFAGKENAIKSGVVMGVTPTYGYSKDINKKLVIDEESAEVVKMIFDLFVNQDYSMQGIANYLSDKGIPSPRIYQYESKISNANVIKKNERCFWRQSVIRELLEDRTYVGDYFYNKTKNKKKLDRSEWKVIPYHHEPIMDLVPFEKAQRLLEKTRSLTPNSRTADGHKYLLGGLLKCNSCYAPKRDFSGRYGWTGTHKHDGDKERYSYNCGRKKSRKSTIVCHTIPLPAAEIENYIVNFVSKLLENPLATYKYQASLASTKLEIDRLKRDRVLVIKRIQDLPTRLKNIKDMYENGRLEKKDFESRYKKIELDTEEFGKSYDELSARISQNSLSLGYIETFAIFKQHYADALKDIFNNRDEIYRILRILIDQIIVYSRPINKDDKIAGLPRNNQEIPYKIDIKLKLPQDYIEQLKGEAEATVALEENVYAIPPEQLTQAQIDEMGITKNEYIQRYHDTQEQFKDKKFGVSTSNW
jgi:site-specific DNA recombinase